MPYHLHITNKNYSSWSMRSWVLLKHFNIPFVEEMHPMLAGPRQPQFKTFSPVARVPCLHDVHDAADHVEGTASPIVVWDSLAIAEYIADAHPDLAIWPTEKAARAWARSAAAEMHSAFEGIRNEMSMNCGVVYDIAPLLSASSVEKNPDAAKLHKDLVRLDELWSEGLKKFGGPYLAGKEFGAIDAFFAPVAVRLFTYPAAQELLGKESKEYAKKLVEEGPVKEWLDAGVKEVGSEPFHEEECLRGGKTVIKDNRVKA
jgi:glutathione S-transferase